MPLRVVPLQGVERLRATTAVLQRARALGGLGGLWEAADVQWWWRRPRPTDALSLPVWFDETGPAAAVCFTAWASTWQVDALTAAAVDLSDVWSAAMEVADAHVRAEPLEVLICEDDEVLTALAIRAGFQATEDTSGLTWMDADQRPPVSQPPEGFVIADRTMRPHGPHPMMERIRDLVERRLRQCSLYDPTLDLCIEGPDGEVAGYALFWLDPITGVGMLEPMRVEDRYRRRGLGKALLTAGLERLATKGAQRLKVGFDGHAGRNLYVGAGFVQVATVRSFSRPPDIPR